MAGLRLPKRAGTMLLALAAFATIAASGPKERWVAAWATSQQIPEPRNALPPEDLKDATLRQIVRLQIGGERFRIRFANTFGTAPLRIDAATLAPSLDLASARIDVGKLKPLAFDGKPVVTIPAGAEYWSDPVDIALSAGADVALTIHLPDAPAQQTSHPGSRATSYYLHGNQVSAPDLPGAKTVDHWYQLGGIETVSAKGSAVVVVGDSITDGSQTKSNTNKRWTDGLQLRLREDPALREMAVLNAGIGGNRLLQDGLGPNALARFDREVLSPPGVTHMIVLEGINDLGTLTRDAPVSAAEHTALVERMIGTMRQMIARAHAHGIKAIGATILPDGASTYYHPDAGNEADRLAVNTWIRAPGNFDGVIDFDLTMRDPEQPTKMRAGYDSGDGLHPSPVGYQVMADFDRARPARIEDEGAAGQGAPRAAPARRRRPCDRVHFRRSPLACLAAVEHHARRDRRPNPRCAEGRRRAADLWLRQRRPDRARAGLDPGARRMAQGGLPAGQPWLESRQPRADQR